ncbi:MAG: cation ABC transporter substrate-binding protein [Rhizobiaceae bacterium]|nr:MAG: cation ABC transporter substrate-binding protein [Rhizobiaceae bacterium]
MRMLSVLATALLAALPLTVAAAAADKIAIVAAENFYGDLARQIGGDRVEVASILSNPDVDPHLFESSPSTARTVSDAAIVIYNGGGYDPWMEKLLAASPSKDRTALVAAALIGGKPGDNPHLWYDPATFPAVAKALEADLEKRDSAHAAFYRANQEKFAASLAEIASEVAAIRKDHAGVAVTATEPVFGYMAEALGFRMLNGAFQTAVMNDTEPSASEIAAFQKSLKDGTARILFYNSQVSDPATTRLLRIASENNIAIVGVTELEPSGKTIQSWFKGQLDAVRKALEAGVQ